MKIENQFIHLQNTQKIQTFSQSLQVCNQFMASEAESAQTQPQSNHETLSLFLPFFLGITNIEPTQTQPDPDQNSPVRPDSQAQHERIIFLNPFMQSMVMMGHALFQGDDEKQGRPPATKEAIQSMDVVDIKENEVGECSICLEDWKNGGGIVKEMPCNHRFHGECIEKWLGIHGSCPVCRFEMPCDQENEEKKGSNNGGERRIWVSFSFSGMNQRPLTSDSDIASQESSEIS